MGKIGDLFIKLGLKKDDFDRGINSAGGSLKGFAAVFGVVASAGAAAFKLVADNALKFAQSFIRHSQQIGDAWDQAMSRGKAAWGQFLSALTSWDWDKFGEKVRGAMDAAAGSTGAHDAEFEVQNSIKLRKSQMQEELSILEIEMRNQKNSYEQRAQYAKDYLDKVRPLYAEETKLREKIMLADKNDYLAKLNVSQTTANRANLETFLTEIAPNESLLNALNQYAKKSSGKKYKLTQDDEKLLNQFFAQYNGDYSTQGTFAQMAAGYMTNSGDKDVEKVMTAITAYYSSIAALNEDTRRIQGIMNSGEAKIDTAAINTASDQRAEQAAKIAQRAEDSAKTEIQLLQEKYDEEKALLQEYGFDTEALTAEHYRNLFKILDDGLSEEVNELMNIEPVQLELAEIDLGDADAIINGFIDDVAEATQKMQDLADEFKNAVIEGFSQGCQELMDQFMGISELNGGAVLQAVLTPLANMAIKTGEVIMAEGVAVEAAKASLTTLGGAGAIAAGAALIAAGAALKSGLSRIAKGGGAGTSASTAADSTTGGRGYEANTEITVRVEGTIKGGDIVLAGSKTQNAWKR